MDHETLPTRTQPTSLRWVVALLLLVAGGGGLVPVVEGDELTRVPGAVVVDRHQRVARRRSRRRPIRCRSTPRARGRLLTALEPRIRTVFDALRRGPPRTPCVVALT